MRHIGVIAGVPIISRRIPLTEKCETVLPNPLIAPFDAQSMEGVRDVSGYKRAYTDRAAILDRVGLLALQLKPM